MNTQQRLDYEDMRLALYLGAKRARLEAEVMLSVLGYNRQNIMHYQRASAWLTSFDFVRAEAVRR